MTIGELEELLARFSPSVEVVVRGDRLCAEYSTGLTMLAQLNRVDE